MKVALLALAILLLLPSCIIAFTPVTFNQNYITIDYQKWACSLDFNVCTTTRNNQVLVFNKKETAYQQVGSFIPDCNSNYVCYFSQNYISEDGSRSISHANNMVMIHSLSNSSYPLIQNISFTLSGTVSKILKGDYMILWNNNQFNFYHFNSSSSTYQVNFTYSYSSSRSYVVGSCSKDGKIVVHLSWKWGDSDVSISIHELDQSTGLYVQTTFGLGYTLGSSITLYDLVVQGENGNYEMVITLYGNNQNNVVRYQLTGTNATLIQDITEFSLHNYKWLYLTRNRQYLLVSVNSRYFQLHQLNTVNNSYVKVHTFSLFANTIQSLLLSQNATFINAIISSNPYNNVFLFNTSIDFCYTYSFIGVCSVCRSGYTLSNGICVCPSGESLLNGACISCNISNCGICSSADTCTQCSNGFVLSGNACTCPTGSSISIYGSCVSCSVSNCYRCDQANICAVSSQGTDTATASTSNSNGSSDTNVIWAVLAVVLVVVVVLLVALVVVVKKFVLLSKMLKKVGNNRDNMKENRTLNPLVEQQISDIPGSTTKIKQEVDSPKKIKRRFRKEDHLQVQPATPLEQ